jgi:hypothetical protein
VGGSNDNSFYFILAQIEKSQYTNDKNEFASTMLEEEKWNLSNTLTCNIC